MNKESSPIFIVGCARSGTTLLRLMLDSHPKIAIPAESHFIIDMIRNSIFKNKYLGKNNFNNFIKDLLFHQYYTQWPESHKLQTREFQQYRGTNITNIFKVIFQKYASKNNKEIWGDKTPKYVNFIILLSELFPKAKFIHLVRDGRDVALSFSVRKRSWGPRNIWQSAHYWRIQTTLGIISRYWFNSNGLTDRYYEIKYESLINNTKVTLKGICDFIGTEFDECMLDYYKFTKQKITHVIQPIHGRLMEKPDKTRIGRWKKHMTEKEVNQFERIAGNLLHYFGYETTRKINFKIDTDNFLRNIIDDCKLSLLSKNKYVPKRSVIIWNWFLKNLNYVLKNYSGWIKYDLTYQYYCSLFMKNIVLY